MVTTSQLTPTPNYVENNDDSFGSTFDNDEMFDDIDSGYEDADKNEMAFDEWVDRCISFDD